MIYRTIGKTGMSASIIGLGAEHLDNRPYEQCEEVIDAALEAEMNIIDVFMPGTIVRDHLSKALKGRRDQVLIQGHIGSVDIREQYDRTRDVPTCRKYFENLMKSFQTDYIDLGMMFYIDSNEDFKGIFETEYINYVQKLKKDGTIRAIGFSSHNPEIAKKVIETGVPEMMMFSINAAYDMLPTDFDLETAMNIVGDSKKDDTYLKGINPARTELYRLCESKGVAITTMKTLGAGKLVLPEYSPFKKQLTVGQCIHYALTRPAVVSTLIGCKSRKEVEEAVKYLTLTEEEKDFTESIQSYKGDFAGECVYCNHCLPCPVTIDIAAMTKMMDIALLNPENIPSEIRMQYESSAQKASDCIECGNCESRCPFNVSVIENMRRATKLFA